MKRTMVGGQREENSSDTISTEFHYLSPRVRKIDIRSYQTSSIGDKIQVQEVNIEDSRKDSILLQSYARMSQSSQMLSDKKITMAEHH